MSEFTDIYKELVILQYYQKTKAQGEIKLWSDEFENVYAFLNEFFTQFDLDQATGDRLDLIGKIVGLSRIVEGGVAKKFFGYDGGANILGYDEGRYFVEGDNLYTDSELTDGQYRLFIKAKITKNNVSAVMVDDERSGLQSAIQSLFNGEAYVIDNQDMSLNLYISTSVNTDDLILIVQANLLPKPQAVRYRWIVQVNHYTPDTLIPVLANTLLLNINEPHATTPDQYVRLPNIDNTTIRTNLTMCAWVKSSATLNVAISIATGSSVTMLTFANGNAGFVTSPAGGLWSVVEASSPVTDDLIHIAATYDGVTAKVYHNGILQNSGPLSPAVASVAADFTIGVHRDLSTGFFEGCIFNSMVLDSVYNDIEILEIVNQGFKQPEDFPSNIKDDYFMALPLNNGVTDPEVDRSVNILDGILVNSPLYDGCAITIPNKLPAPFGYEGAPDAAGYDTGTYADVLTLP